jgi:transcriptional regulator with XRE-family HTH domain
LKKLGQDISVARRKRRIPVALVAERASISRTTLRRIEIGNTGVSVGSKSQGTWASREAG